MLHVITFVTALTIGALMLLSESVAAEAETARSLGVRGPEAESGTNAIVLLAVRWDRRWKCGRFENAQLRVIAFDKLPSTKVADDAPADLLLDEAPALMTKPFLRPAWRRACLRDPAHRARRSRRHGLHR